MGKAGNIPKSINGRMTKEFAAYSSMRARTLQTSKSEKERHGGTICEGMELEEAWKIPDGFEDFYEHVGPSPEKTMLDRIDNSKGYIKGNLKWSTLSESNKNKRNARMLTAFGQVKHLSEWATEFGLTKACIYRRLERGWNIEKTLSTPSDKKYT